MQVPEGWKKVHLGELVTESALRNSNGKLGDFDLRSVNKFQGMIPMKDRVKGKSTDRCKVVKNGWFAYNPMRINIGSICQWQNKNDCLVSPDYVVFRCKEKILDPSFMDQFRQSSHWQNFMNNAGNGSVRIRIYMKDLAPLKLSLPPFKEQQKIAQILSTWDKAIEKLEALIAAKQKRKKALMQQLLTGKKRFAGFERHWKTYILSELGNTFNGLTGKDKDDFGFGKPFIPYLNIFQNSRIDTSQLELVNIGELDNQNKVKYGDIFFTTSSETPDEVGMSSVLLEEVDEAYLNSFCFGFRLKNFETLHPEFARYLFRAEHIRKLIAVLAQGATRYNLSKTQLLKIKLEFPCIKEQQTIAAVLSAADKEIETHQNQLAALKEQKKGLMQQLLTGKKRVTTDAPAQRAAVGV